MFLLRHRAEFLSHMKPLDNQSSATSGPDSGNWTLVDEGGEEVKLTTLNVKRGLSHVNFMDKIYRIYKRNFLLLSLKKKKNLFCSYNH